MIIAAAVGTGKLARADLGAPNSGFTDLDFTTAAATIFLVFAAGANITFALSRVSFHISVGVELRTDGRRTTFIVSCLLILRARIPAFVVVVVVVAMSPRPHCQ